MLFLLSASRVNALRIDNILWMNSTEDKIAVNLQTPPMQLSKLTFIKKAFHLNFQRHQNYVFINKTILLQCGFHSLHDIHPHHYDVFIFYHWWRNKLSAFLPRSALAVPHSSSILRSSSSSFLLLPPLPTSLLVSPLYSNSLSPWKLLSDSFSVKRLFISVALKLASSCCKIPLQENIHTYRLQAQIGAALKNIRTQTRIFWWKVGFELLK